MSDLTNPRLSYRIPREIILETLSFLRGQGRLRCEGVVLWPAEMKNGACHVVECMIPEQYSSSHSYVIPDREVFRIVEYVARRELVIPIQVHSHPSSAFHSETDDEHAFVQHTNGISIVVPNFGRVSAQDFFSGGAIYMLTNDGYWRLLAQDEISRRFEMVVRK